MVLSMGVRFLPPEQKVMEVEEKIQKNVILAPLTTFKIGGPAKFFVEVKEKEDLFEATKWADENKEQIFILGGGSKVLINDKGVNGLVIKMSNDNVAIHGDRIECGAGAALAQVVGLTIGANLSGLEWGIGIPKATSGGFIRGNAGAFGSSIAEIVETVEVFNIKKQKFELFSNRDCRFGYRTSIFKEDNNFLIWSALLKLAPGDSRQIEKNINQYLKFRQGRQPKLPSAGSVFKNLSFDYLKNFNSEMADLAMKSGAVAEGKIGAGWVIELAGLPGKKIGGAKVSLEHSNFIINTGRATAEDVVVLISYIKQQIRNRFGIQLQEEIQYFGF